MATFTYCGLQPDGQRVEGELEAEDRAAATRQLSSGELVVTEIRQKRQALGTRLGFAGRRLKEQKVIFFAHSLATLHRSGVALSSALELMARQASDENERRVIESVRSQVMRGRSLAEALSDQEPAFPALLAGAVEVGEVAGALDRTLDSAASLLERDEAAKAQLRSALRYPILVIAAVAVALVVLLTFVVPRFAKTYAELGAALPLPTVILIQVSSLLVNHWYLPVGGGALMVVAGWRALQTEGGRRRFESLVFRVPVVGSVVVKSLTSRTCEILRVLSEAGLPVLYALEMAAKTIGNHVFSTELLEVRNAVAEGQDLASRFRSSRVFPALTGELIAVGERSGALEQMLETAAQFYRQETDRERKRMTALIEPALTVCLGLLVLGIALAIFLPIWDSVSLYRGG